MEEPKPTDEIIRTYRKGEIIFSEGSPGQEMYEIITGAVKVVTQKHGREVVLNHLKSGEIFGEMALVDGEPRSGAAVADKDDTRLVVLDLAHFLSRLQQEPEFSLTIMHTLSERIRRRDTLYLKLMDKTGEENALPQVLATLLNEILRIVPPADAVRIRLLECPLPGMEQRLVPGLAIDREPNGSSVPIIKEEPEVAVRSLGESIVGYAAETRQVQSVADLSLSFESQPEESKEGKQRFDAYQVNVKRKAENVNIYNHKHWGVYLEQDLTKVASDVSIPLMAGDVLLGVISVLSQQANVFSSQDVVNLEFIAEKAVVAILQAKTELITKVGRLAEKLTGHFDLDTLGNTLSEEVKSCIPGSLVDLYHCRYDESISGGKFQRIAYSGASEEEKAFSETAPRQEGGLGLDAIRQQCFVFEEHVDDPSNERASINARKVGIKSTGCLPLIFENEVVGVLYIHSKNRHYFSQHEAEALDVLGSLAAVAIHNIENVGRQLPTYKDLFGDSLERVFQEVAADHSPLDEVDTLIAAINEIIKSSFFEALKKVRGLSEMNDCVTNTVKALGALLKMPDDFIKKFVTLAGDETFLQRLQNYRDHYLHSFHVFLLGYLRHLTWWRQGMTDIVPKTVSAVRHWFTSAIFHDVAYAVERSEDALEAFFKDSMSEGVSCQIDMSSLISSQHTNIIEHYEALKKEFSNDQREQAEFVRWLYKHLVKTKSHGILAAIILLNLNWDESDRVSFALESALTIILHNYHDSPEAGWKMSFNDYPQAGLLTYCDEIQERDYYGSMNTGKSGFVKLSDLKYERNSMDCKLLYDGKQTDFSAVCSELEQKAKNVSTGWEVTSTVDKQAFYLQGDLEKTDEVSSTDQYLLIG